MYFLFNTGTNLSINFAIDNFSYPPLPFYSSQNLYPSQQIQTYATFSGINFNFANTEFINFQPSPSIPINPQGIEASISPIQVEEMQKQRKKKKKQIESARKNSESNIANHFFSFINSRQKSLKAVQDCIATLPEGNIEQRKEKLIYLFYNAAHVLNTRKSRKYVNKKNLMSLFSSSVLLQQVPQIKQRVKRVSDQFPDAAEKLSLILRKCCHRFLKTQSIECILTSRRISNISKQEHLKKRRKLIKAILQ